jgi:general secretion pathway protein C
MKRYFTLINIILLTVIVFFGVDLFYKVAEEKLDVIPMPTTSNKRVRQADVARNQPLSRYDIINQRNLFSIDKNGVKKPAPPSPPVETVQEIKPTQLRLKLWGTVTGNPGKEYAVIEDEKNRSQELFTVDDTIQDAVIKKIERERVILHVNGFDEVLEMEKLGIASGKKSRFSKKKQASFRKRAPHTQNIQLSRNVINNAVSNINNLMRQARFRPHFSQGRPDGLALTRVNPNSLFSRLGLRTGDVITGVDGKKIRSVDDALRFYDNLKNASDIQLQIKRGGSLQNLHYSIQ